MFQIGYVECAKDRYDLLKETIMPSLYESLKKLQKSCVVTVFDKTDPNKLQSFVVPRNINMRSIRISEHKVISFTCGDDAQQLHEIKFNACDDVFHWNLQCVKTISQFFDFYIGDLAFLALILGLVNSDSYWCVLCSLNGRTFNCDEEQVEEKLRTMENIRELLVQYIESGEKTPNILGVNSKPLLPVDPARLIVPILHCPMGLVDKLLEVFSDWVYFNVLELDELSSTHRKRFIDAEKRLELAIQRLDEKRRAGVAAEQGQGGDRAQTAEEFREAQKEKNEAVKERASANRQWKQTLKSLRSEVGGYHSKLEKIYKRHNISREYYHGGKFNGVNCIRLMGKSESIFEKRDDSLATVNAINSKCEQFRELFGNQDAIWSSVRGVQGLLPSDAELDDLEQALKHGKKLWIEAGISTLQPKWHLTFDFHLLKQMRKFGGLADKSDETIEKGHQEWKTYQQRYARVGNFQQQQLAIRKAWKRGRHPRIRQAATKVAVKIGAHSKQTSRKRAAEENKQATIEIKKEKRARFIGKED
jgi:hypothetical protein